MIDAGRHPRITLMTCSEVTRLEGSCGDFHVGVRTWARQVDESKCTGCGDCARNCPVVVPNEFEVGMGARKAIYIPFQQAIPFVYLIDRRACLNRKFIVCERCRQACDRGAIDYDMSDRFTELEVGAVIVATGFDEVDPEALSSYGYKRFENVLYSLEFERLTNATGPTSGRILRPSDHREVNSIAFINCVGSRALRYNPYCSSVCCMFTTKQALVARESNHNLESTIFFIDVRAAGKGFRGYVDRAAAEDGIRYIRGGPSKITEDDDRNLVIHYEDTASGRVRQLTVEMVVLASSLAPHRSIMPLAEVLGIDLDPHRFVRTDPFDPLRTSRSGIYTCGFCQGPAGVAESVAMASGAAARVAEVIFHSTEAEVSP